MISIAAGASSGSVSIAAPSDDVYLDAGSVTATIASCCRRQFRKPRHQPGGSHDCDHDTIDVTTVRLTADSERSPKAATSSIRRA